MRIRILSIAAIAVLLLNTFAFAAVDARSARAKRREAARLVSVLPASDGVAIFDAKRFFNDALPKVLSANQPMLGHIMSEVANMESKTGIDLRKFDQIAVGVAFKAISEKETDIEPVAIASGDINSTAIITAARVAAKDVFREEAAGDKTIFIISPKDVAQKTPSASTNAKVKSIADKALGSFNRDVAVAALDRSTIVIGSVDRVRTTLAGNTHVNAEVSGFLSQRGTSILTFAVKMPSGVSQMLPAEFDSLDTSVGAIKFVSGSLDVTTVGTAIKIAARTGNADQALQLKDTMEVLQSMGGSLMSASKKPDQKMYGRLLKSAKLDARGTDVTLDILVPQADIDLLVAKLIK